MTKLTKIKEIRLKNEAELRRDLAAMQEKLRTLRFKLHSQELKNPKELHALRKDIAKFQTILKEKSLAK